MPYDGLQLMLFTFALHMMYLRSWEAFRDLAGLAFWCKEVSALLLGVYAIMFRKDWRSKHYRDVLVHCFWFFIMAHFICIGFFGDNGGSGFEFNFNDHVRAWKAEPILFMIEMAIVGLYGFMMLVSYDTRSFFWQAWLFFTPALFLGFFRPMKAFAPLDTFCIRSF